MLKSSKLSHRKSHKSSKESEMRKSHVSKKRLHSRSPVRMSGSSRPPPVKRISPGMKRGPPPPKRKASRSPRLRSVGSPPRRSLSHRKPESPVSVDRVRAMKSAKYEKGHRMPNSPVRPMVNNPPHRHPLQRDLPPRDPRDLPPVHTERYPSSSANHPTRFLSPTRKKTHRDDDHYFPSGRVSASPPRRHMPDPHHLSESRVPRRAENIPPMLHHPRDIPIHHEQREKHYDVVRSKRESPPIMPRRDHSKGPPHKIPYPNETPRYRSPSPGNRYPPESTKAYGPTTLHERFSTVVETTRTDPRVRYSREDLSKITIDIKNTYREPPPAIRHILNPPDMMNQSRRPNEPHRPIFDREEIKQSSRALREDPYYDHKASSYGSARPVDLREVENYQITRRRDEVPMLEPSGRRSLGDRYPVPEGRKDAGILDRDERDKEYRKAIPAPLPHSRGYIEPRSRSRSHDRDFRAERYMDVKPSTSRPEYPSRPPPLNSAEPRNSVPYRKSTLPVGKHDRDSHLAPVRPEPKEHYLNADRHYAEPPHSSRVERRDYYSPPPPLPLPDEWNYAAEKNSREKYSDIPRRSEKSFGRPWPDKPDIPPRSSHHLEPESRDGPSSMRGSSRPYRSSRGFRSRGFRGISRGSSSFRGSFRGGYRNSTSPRGRGIPRR